MVSAKKVPAIAMSFGVSFALLHFLCLAACLNESPGQNQKEEKLCPENFTRILDSLLDGYDNRLRPGFGALRLPHTNYLLGPDCWAGEGEGKESKMGTWGSAGPLLCALRMDFSQLGHFAQSRLHLDS
uniref:Neurotransmitter-gated ion-channel ligand-binding domain-containing protein n=1 Tax=Capra hircus TaxID=9925 RepID=A0A8C2S137_CAPHI